MKRPVIALSPIFLVFTDITSFLGLLPASFQASSVEQGREGTRIRKRRRIYGKTQSLRVFSRAKTHRAGLPSPTTVSPFCFRRVVPVVNQIRTYWWCSPPRTGRQRMLPARSTARETGASFSKDRCVRTSL